MFEAMDASPHVAFQHRLSAGEMRLQRCEDCSSFVYPPRVLCPSCGGVTLSWQPISGRGTVYSATVIRQKAERGGDYSIALVDLDEGPRMMSSIREIDPPAVAIGMRVTARIEEEDGLKLIRFTPAAGAVA